MLHLVNGHVRTAVLLADLGLAIANPFPDVFLSTAENDAQKQSLRNHSHFRHVAVEMPKTRLPRSSVEKARDQCCLFSAVTGARCAALDSLESLHQ